MRSETAAVASSFAENVGHLLARITYRPIETETDLDAVRRLRYSAYLKEGAIAANDSGRLADRYDGLDNAVNIGVFYADKLVAAKRFHFLSKPDDLSPTLTTFPEI
jgi:hypothetical protein